MSPQLTRAAAVTGSLADPATYLDGPPFAEFARRRREAPVSWVAEVPLRRHSARGTVVQRVGGYWAVTGHAAVVAASRRPEIFSSAERGAFLADPTSRADLERSRQLLVGMDPPAHTRLRRVVTAAFTAPVVRGMRAAIAEHARQIVRRATAGQPVDAVAEVAAELPLLVLADLLGIPREDRGLFLRWSNNLVGFDDPAFGGGDVEVFKQTFVEAFGYALTAAKARRRDPGDDLVSRLVTAEVDGRRLTESEYCHLWLLLVVAGNETTRHLISGGLDLLADRPDLADRLARQPDLVPTAVDEMLRWTTPIMQFRRTAVVDTELAGQPIRAGDKVVLYYISANRDESVFDRPETFLLDRSPNPHLAFGVGPHFCLGSHLARVEAAVLFEELAPHLPRLRRAGPAVRLESNFMNGLKQLPVTFAAG
ncbi:cytochrome P450 [Micromonospora echinaurantiaca]|uniref:cytochrome P450 n=1 Tax=Micromonospora echinaurantiaca TaxID=47857 RepID=UPI0034392C35